MRSIAPSPSASRTAPRTFRYRRCDAERRAGSLVRFVACLRCCVGVRWRGLSFFPYLAANLPIIRRSVGIPVYSLLVPLAPREADGLSCVTLYVMISILIIILTGRRTFHVAPLVVSNEWKLLRERA
ncbi:hypothetical protein [Burkholderia vietnamiensis]|uniref:hypothetical protein n=1 Tax=Burkholderia vietnamiensis TaxID=60552 RepID=UPI0012D89B56|nr:hypothetical protein [Burkholderia vietnamiensis]MDN7929648.1 hypothetical protein [Burkholderia vietnamiensis]HDR9253985.1 hypothetical protein [Burkholderia vietnamiensis]